VSWWNRPRYTFADFAAWWGGFLVFSWAYSRHLHLWQQWLVGLGCAIPVSAARRWLNARRRVVTPPNLPHMVEFDPEYRCPTPCPDDCGLSCWSPQRRIIDSRTGIVRYEDRRL
jgi:hypothetical protein